MKIKLLFVFEKICIKSKLKDCSILTKIIAVPDYININVFNSGHAPYNHWLSKEKKDSS